MIIFGSVRFLSKKNKQIKKKLKKLKPVQTDEFRFGSVFWIKTGSNWFGSVFRFCLIWLGFFRFGSVFLVLARFFSVWVRLGFFDFRLTETDPVGFSKF
jgi:hypothetical protein